jgi:hypothetical protein
VARVPARLFIVLADPIARAPLHTQTNTASDLDAAGSELHANRGLGLQAELIPGEPAQQVGLPHS